MNTLNFPGMPPIRAVGPDITEVPLTYYAVEIKAKSHSASNTAPRLGWLVYLPDAHFTGFVDAGQAGSQALYQHFPRSSVTVLCSLQVTPAEWREAKRNQIRG